VSDGVLSHVQEVWSETKAFSRKKTENTTFFICGGRDTNILVTDRKGTVFHTQTENSRFIFSFAHIAQTEVLSLNPRFPHDGRGEGPPDQGPRNGLRNSLRIHNVFRCGHSPR